MLESSGLLAVILLIVGLIILVAEVFVPSGGILAILTSITLCLSLAAAYTAWYEAYPVVWWLFCGLVILTIPSTLGTAFYLLPRTSVGRRIILEAPTPEEVEPFGTETARLEQLVGQYGKAQTQLSPSGLVLVNGERLHAFTEGHMIDPASSIQVLEIRGTRLLVRQSEPPAAQKETTTDSDPSRVDFDYPLE